MIPININIDKGGAIKSSMLRKQLLGGWIFSLIAGTLLHFEYQWTGYARWAAFFSPVNESTWEHLKLLFFPMALYLLFQLFILGKGKNRIPGLIPASALSILTGMLFIVVVFYTYTGILGFSVVFIDILLFAVAVTLSYYQIYVLSRQGALTSAAAFIAGILILFGVAALFFWFTFYPPAINLFQPPLTA